MSSILQFISSILEFTTPIFINMFVNYIETPNKSTRYGILLIGSIVVAKFLFCILQTHASF